MTVTQLLNALTCHRFDLEREGRREGGTERRNKRDREDIYERDKREAEEREMEGKRA